MILDDMILDAYDIKFLSNNGISVLCKYHLQKIVSLFLLLININVPRYDIYIFHKLLCISLLF